MLPFALIYFLFPALLYLPIILIYGEPEPPGRLSTAVHGLVLPIRYLDAKLPAYRRLFEKESELLGLGPARRIESPR